MLGFLRVFGLLVVLACAPYAQAQTQADEAGVHAVITRQLEAITSGDGAAAFAMASPSIQSLFATQQTFMTMVERGYPEIFRSRNHRFLKFEMIDGVLVQRVLIESDRGSVVVRYEMIEVDGQWRVNGCTIETRQDA